MSATATAPADIDDMDDDSIFDVSTYDLPIPKMDGYKAVQLDIRLAGAGR